MPSSTGCLAHAPKSSWFSCGADSSQKRLFSLRTSRSARARATHLTGGIVLIRRRLRLLRAVAVINGMVETEADCLTQVSLHETATSKVPCYIRVGTQIDNQNAKGRGVVELQWTDLFSCRRDDREGAHCRTA